MANTYLSKTMSGGSATTTKFTISVWVKRAGLNDDTIVSCSNDYCYLGFQGGNKLFLELHDVDNVRLRTNALFRDTNAWYHIVASYDSTQSTASDRMKLYVNGEQITSFNVANYPSQNYGAGFGGNLQHSVGRREIDDTDYFSGSISHLHLCAGYTYDASAFGETDATTGEWKINTSPSVTYGNNGFFILKDGNSVTDQSGNSNNFTVSGGTLTKTEDCPSNVFSTMNSLDNFYPSATFSNGNNTVVTNATAICPITGTLGMTSGKYYWEVKAASHTLSDSWYTIGITGRQTTELNQELGNYAYQYGYMGEDGTVRNNSSNIATLSTYTAGDIIGIALDLDNNLIYFYKNGAVQNSGTGLAVSSAASTDLGAYFPAVADWSSQATFTFQTNFGNGYFGTTAVSSAGTNASNNGIFEYDVPTGYTALSTKGLNL